MVVGILRVKNEARWIARCIDSILPVCDRIIVLDDHSTDATPDLCRQISPKVTLYPSPFMGLNEVRDKNWLLDRAQEIGTVDWVVSIDGDEVLMAGMTGKLLAAMGGTGDAECLSLRILYLWDSEHRVRVDGVYGDFHRESVFRPTGERFVGRDGANNFHCGNVPWKIRQKRAVLRDVPLLHFGYMDQEDRVRKYHWYNEKDPGNRTEDGYRHMVVGDLFPAESRFSYGGPLLVKPLGMVVGAGA